MVIVATCKRMKALGSVALHTATSDTSWSLYNNTSLLVSDSSPIYCQKEHIEENSLDLTKFPVLEVKFYFSSFLGTALLSPLSIIQLFVGFYM